MELLRNVESPTGNSTLTAKDGDGNALYLVRDADGAIWLPVSVGMRIALQVQSHVDALLAFPVIVANPDGTEAQNIWGGTAVDPNALTSKGDMWEVYNYGTFLIDSFMLSGQQGRPFTVVPAGEGMGFGGGDASTFFVYERTQRRQVRGGPTARATQTATLHTPSGNVQGGGVAIGAGDVQAVETVRTDAAYNADAVLVAALRLVDREQMHVKLTEAGVQLPSWSWYTPARG
jgi:hypothetical protein